MIRRDVAKYRF